jgi:Activator of Hsp90 ATPase homolog 1-like protein
MSFVALGPVEKAVDVKRSAADAYRLFVDDISRWWPMKEHSRAKDALGESTIHVEFQARVGGRIFETLNTGEERDWGEVLEVEPDRLRFSFQMGREKDKSGEVEIRFEALSTSECRVRLIHTHWERFGDEAETMRNAFSRGWDFVFIDGFGAYAALL